MMRAGHLETGVDTDLAIRVYRHVVHDIDPSPLTSLARQTIANVHHVLHLLVRARRMGAAEVTRSLGDILSRLGELSATQTVLILCARDSEHEKLIQVLDRCSQAGLTNLSVGSMN